MGLNSGTELEKDIQNIKRLFERCCNVLRNADKNLSDSNKKYSRRRNFIFRRMIKIFVKY